MIIEDVRAALQKRISTDDEWDYGVNQCRSVEWLPADLGLIEKIEKYL